MFWGFLLFKGCLFFLIPTHRVMTLGRSFAKFLKPHLDSWKVFMPQVRGIRHASQLGVLERTLLSRGTGLMDWSRWVGCASNKVASSPWVSRTLPGALRPYRSSRSSWASKERWIMSERLSILPRIMILVTKVGSNSGIRPSCSLRGILCPRRHLRYTL